ncbi:MAG: beta-N-acetylhexosaminidase [Alphaproteobacteria bacterium]|nr:beta-N-acetylhexosaminidase [Alphaproteobacteria bacterium]
MTAKAVIFGCAGHELTAAEQAFFRAEQPWGFILFARNCASPAQVRALTESLRESVGRADAPILIDQEGGRVQRLRGEHWRSRPAAAAFGVLCCSDAQTARDLAYDNARVMAVELVDLGINVDCVPCLDVPVEGSHDVIGDRAFARDPKVVANLGQSVIDGMLDGGVLPVIKHIPGHGRARADSHFALPVVDAPRAELERSDFLPFRALAHAPLAMTAHVVYTDIDPQAPATTSKRVIDEIVRGFIGFDGALMTDDLSMRALGGSFGDRARSAIAAGCDLVLHCNGDMDEMREVAAAVPALSDKAFERTRAALSSLRRPAPFAVAEAQARLDAGLARVA